jgi:voltage-dependent calcium channel
MRCSYFSSSSRTSDLLFWDCIRLFLFNRLEAIARICVSGFLLDPEVPTSSLFVWPFSTDSSVAITSSSNMSTSVSRQASLTRGLTVRQKLRQVQRNVLRPFRLAHNSPSSSYPHESATMTTTTIIPTIPTTPSRSRTDTNSNVFEKTKNKIDHLRNPSQPTFFAKALRSDQPDVVSLPFRLNVAGVHDKIQRNVPYLRHSWSRIDFVAIVSFWITFILASVGVERGTHHIGIFRAMSVLRTARLLAISSGTTVSGEYITCFVTLLICGGFRPSCGRLKRLGHS